MHFYGNLPSVNVLIHSASSLQEARMCEGLSSVRAPRCSSLGICSLSPVHVLGLPGSSGPPADCLPVPPLSAPNSTLCLPLRVLGDLLSLDPHPVCFSWGGASCFRLSLLILPDHSLSKHAAFLLYGYNILSDISVYVHWSIFRVLFT